MEIYENLINKNTLGITFKKGEFTTEERYITIKGKSNDEIFQEKVKLIEDLDFCNINFRDSKKAMIKAYSKLDEKFVALYKKLYNDKQDVYHYVITTDEKEYLDKMLDYYRNQNA